MKQKTETQEIKKQIENWLGSTHHFETIEKIPGDASTRKYYRLVSNHESFILMSMDPFSEQEEGLPFIEVQKHLLDNGIEVPKIHAVDSQNGFILLEDLGDVTLLRRLQEVSDVEVERHLYQEVIDQLVKMHYAASRQTKRIQAFNLFFDEEKLMWEMLFTIEHFYELYLKRELANTHRKIILERFKEICQTLAKEQVVFTHRDFHSRNVMVHKDRFVMIDFQDARMGPKQYDLASLLKDSYYQLEENQIKGLIDYYVARWEAISGETIDKAQFTKIFDFMAVQRNFKAIGSFASFLNRRGNATYLKYIGNTFENIRRTLLKYPEFSDLREVLFHYYYF